MIGLKRGVVILKDHNREWSKLFNKEANLISSKISNYLVDIQHIGSTAIPGTVAKPIIDIAVAIDDLSNVKKVIPPLQKIGYKYRGEQGIPDRHLFVKGDEESRTHHMHMMDNTSDEWKKHILFKDYLRQNPLEAKQYSELKKKLVIEFEFDREKYTDGKEEFIQRILDKAKENQ
ncbi:MAG: GrpB family protein [Candidatus Heimdallarchaeota archaeon]|nr:GrpB family protein [Candidatus Heimdallarchaeota archaeon]MCK4877749.1 GrpB family protein [Candidatus Heimdallarchaeota archaeon]